MEALELKFMFTNGDEIEVEVEPDTILEDAWKQMVDAEAIKPLPADKTLVISNNENQILDIKRSVADCNVQNGDVLHIAYEGKA